MRIYKNRTAIGPAFCMQALSSVVVSAILRIARCKHAIADQQFNDFPFDNVFHDTVLSFWPDAPAGGDMPCVRLMYHEYASCATDSG